VKYSPQRGPQKIDSILASCPRPYESDLLQVMTGERSLTSGGIALACGTPFRAFALSAALAGAFTPMRCFGDGTAPLPEKATRGSNSNRLLRYGRSPGAKAGCQR
jgi:hypothetical protein